MKPKKHYVDNKLLYETLVEYRKKLEVWEAAGGESSGIKEPPVPNFIGKSIIDIATKYSYSSNWINYSYRDEMIGDGIEACVYAIKKFDYNKYENPHAYFTKCCFYAFINRLNQEKYESVVKSNIIKEIGADAFDLQDQDLDQEFKNTYIEFMRTHSNIDDSFLKKKKKKVEVEKIIDSSELREFLE